jgi:hypothetical protein
VLLGLLLDALAPRGPVVLGLDDTIERRRGKRIGAKGIYRDPVRSSKSFFVKTTGLRWLSLMLLVPIPWAGTRPASSAGRSRRSAASPSASRSGASGQPTSSLGRYGGARTRPARSART